MSDFVFNDILCYTISTIESKSNSAILNECVAFYGEEDIKKTKEEICSILKIGPIWQRGDTRKRDNVKDVLDIIEKCDIGELPTFITKSHLAFSPTFGYELIQNTIVSMVEQIANLKEELASLRTSNHDNKEILHNTNVLKEEIIEIKSELAELRSNNPLNSSKVNNVNNLSISTLVPSSPRRNREIVYERSENGSSTPPATVRRNNHRSERLPTPQANKQKHNYRNRR